MGVLGWNSAHWVSFRSVSLKCVINNVFASWLSERCWTPRQSHHGMGYPAHMCILLLSCLLLTCFCFWWGIIEYILKPAFLKICLANTNNGVGFLSCLFPCCFTLVDKSHEEDMGLCAVDMQGDKWGSPSFGGHLDLFGVECY